MTELVKYDAACRALARQHCDQPLRVLAKLLSANRNGFLGGCRLNGAKELRFGSGAVNVPAELGSLRLSRAAH